MRKFTQLASWREVHEFFNLFAARVDDNVQTFTPMRAVPVVHLGPNGDRLITPMVWGLTDRSSDGRRTPKHMHARGETMHQLHTFGDAFHARRGITFANTFNEGREVPLAYEDGERTGKLGPSSGLSGIRRTPCRHRCDLRPVRCQSRTGV